MQHLRVEKQEKIFLNSLKIMSYLNSIFSSGEHKTSIIIVKPDCLIYNFKLRLHVLVEEKNLGFLAP